MDERCQTFRNRVDPRLGFAFFPVAIVGLSLTVTTVGGRLIAAHDRALEQGLAGLDYANAMGLGLIAAAPTIALMFAAFAVLRVGLLWSQGHRLSEPMAARVKDLGEALLSAAVWAAFLAPNLLRWIPGEGGFTFQLSNFAVATFLGGVVFLAAADLLRDAARKESEAELFV